MPRRKSNYDDTTVSLDAGDGKGPQDITGAMKRIEQHDELRNYVDRLVRLSEEKAEIAEQIREVREKAKGDGFSDKAIMVLVKHEMETAEKRAEREALEEEVDRMKSALGAFVGTPLGRATVERSARAN